MRAWNEASLTRKCPQSWIRDMCSQEKAEGDRRRDSCCCREGVENDSTGKRSPEQTEENSTEGHGAKYASWRHHITAESNVEKKKTRRKRGQIGTGKTNTGGNGDDQGSTADRGEPR